MQGEILNAPAQTPLPAEPHLLPKHLLFSISARIGGSGLDVDALEALRASYRGGFLARAIAYDNRQDEIPPEFIRSLRWHPVRLLSSLERPYYYGAKKKYLGWIAARELKTGRYDFFHSWSGDCAEALHVAKRRGIPSMIEIPTWHRDQGKKVRHQPEPRKANLNWYQEWRESLLLDRDRYIEEYDLADLIIVLSQKAAETFRVAGFADDKLYYLPRGVDVQRFRPGVRPNTFRVIFSGALIERKGIQHLLEAWHRLDLKNAELWLVGTVHDEAKPWLKKFWRDNIRVIGWARNPETYLSQCSVHAFPSQLEGNAKVTCEAAACGLPQITTREAGDIVRDGIEGIIVQPRDVDALCAALLRFYNDPQLVQQMGDAARKRVVENFTWDHFRTRLLGAYELAMQAVR